MSIVRDPERILAAWLDAGPSRLPDATRQAILASVRSTTQARPGVLPRPRPGPTRHQILGLAAAAAVLATLGVAGLVGTGPTTPEVTTAPSPIATPSPGPSASLGPASGMVRFSSDVYSYSIEYPAQFTASKAVRPWSGEALWPDPFYLMSTEIADVLDGPGPWRLEVVAKDAPTTTRLEDIAAGPDLKRPQLEESTGHRHCKLRPGYIAEGTWDGRWSAATIGSHPALVRDDCGFQDAVVIVGQRAYVFSLATDALYMHHEGGPTFDELISTVMFEPPAPSPSPCVTRPMSVSCITVPAQMVVPFTSERYAYSLRHPDDCFAQPAESAWLPTTTWVGEEQRPVRWDEPPVSDAICGRPFWYTGASAEVSEGTIEADWLAEHVAARTERAFAQPCDGYESTDWASHYVDQRRWLSRTDCGSLDAVVFEPGRAWVFSMRHSLESSDEARAWTEFDALLGTVVLPDESPSVMFRSDIYGYDMWHPSEWTATAATTPWSGSIRSRSEPPTADRLDGPNTSPYPESPWFAVVATDLAPETTVDAWATSHVPQRAQLESVGDHRHCAFRPSHGGAMFVETGWTADWSDGQIGGQPSRVRAACGFVDAVVGVGDRVYVFSMFTRRDGGQDTAEFDAITETVRFESES